MVQQSYSEEEKHRAVRLANYRRSDHATEQRLGISQGLIARWREAGYGPGAPEVTATDDLIARVFQGRNPEAPPPEPPRLEVVRPERQERPAEPARSPAPVTRIARASDLVAARWELIWRGRFPSAALTVIAGAPGLGKSTLETAIAGDLTREGMTGIISNLEDDPEAVLLPRLIAAEADLDKVMLIRPEDTPMLPRDLGRLADLVRSSGARFLMLDPIAAHFRPARAVHDRALLAALGRLAREENCAIIGIHHTRKAGRSFKMAAIEAIGGEQGGLSGAARAVYLYGFDPKDEDRRALAAVKVNGIDRPPTLIIEHETVEVAAGEMALEAGHLIFIEEANTAAEEVLARGAKLKTRDAEAAEWLVLFLAKAAGCTRSSNEIRTQGREAGIGWATLQRAGVELHVTKGKIGFGKDQYWFWQLPPEHPMRKAAERGAQAEGGEG